MRVSRIGVFMHAMSCEHRKHSLPPAASNGDLSEFLDKVTLERIGLQRLMPMYTGCRTLQVLKLYSNNRGPSQILQHNINSGRVWNILHRLQR